MRLSARFMLDSLFVVVGGFLAVASMAWSAGTAGWMAFGMSTGVAAIAAVSAALAKKTGHRVGHSVIVLVGLWSLFAALVFSGSALTWLVFADAIAVGVLGLADLAMHEATSERIVHLLEVRDFSRTAA